MFTRRIYSCVKSIPGFEQTQVNVSDDISGPVAPGVVQPSGRAQLEANLERCARRPFIEERHRHRGLAPKNRHHWSGKNSNTYFHRSLIDLSFFFVPPWVDIDVLAWNNPLGLHPQRVLHIWAQLTPVPPQWSPSHLIKLDKISVE